MRRIELKNLRCWYIAVSQSLSCFIRSIYVSSLDGRTEYTGETLDFRAQIFLKTIMTICRANIGRCMSYGNIG